MESVKLNVPAPAELNTTCNETTPAWESVKVTVPVLVPGLGVNVAARAEAGAGVAQDGVIGAPGAR